MRIPLACLAMMVSAAVGAAQSGVALGLVDSWFQTRSEAATAATAWVTESTGLCSGQRPCWARATGPGRSPRSARLLSIDRIFADPSLDGPAPRQVKIAPDGSLVTYLRLRSDERNRYDLWAFDTRSGRERMLVDSNELDSGRRMSAEAQAMLERKRLVGTKGIVSYAFSNDGSRLFIPASGDAFIFRLHKKPCGSGFQAANASGGKSRRESLSRTPIRDRSHEAAGNGDCLKRALDTEAWETDIQLSPDNRRLAFVRGSNVWVKNLASGKELAITTDGGGTLSYGSAEFIAQEEMGRYTGLWWSPDGGRLAYTRVDESPVDIAKRVEYHAESTEVVEQRYPYAGTANAAVTLHVHDLASGNSRRLELGKEAEYLYRVDWFPDGRHLAVQIQPRDLRTLELLRVNAESGGSSRLIREQSPIWIRLQDNLTFVEGTEEFIWSSRRSGFRHLYLYDSEGELVRQLTDGKWEIAGDRAVAGVDPERRVVYFTAHAESPLTRHLYVQSLDATDPTAVNRITHGDGIHEVTLADNKRVFVDVFDSTEQPPSISLYTVNGVLEGWISKNALDEDHPYAPHLDNHVKPVFGTIEAQDGQALHYRLYRPAGSEPDKRYPVLVYVYGGPTGQQVTRHWPSTVEHWLQAMAQRGYAVFTLDNRGTDNRGRAFDAPVYRKLGQVEVEDQLAGVEWLKSQPWVDPKRIGVFGWSYGGYMALMLLAQSPGTFAAGVSGGPVTDWRLYDTYYTERFMDRPQDNPEGYEQGDVLAHGADISDPLLVIHGMADDNVLFKHSTRLFKFLQDNGQSFEMMTYPGAKHSLHRVSGTGPHALKHITRFLDEYLLKITTSREDAKLAKP